MKINYKKYEIMLITILATTYIINYFLDYWRYSSQYIEDTFAYAFRAKHLHFNYTTNVLIPQILCVLAIYTSYLWPIPLIKSIAIRISKKEKINWLFLVSQLALVIVLLVSLIDVANHYAHTNLGTTINGFFGILGNYETNQAVLAKAFRATEILLVYSSFRLIVDLLIRTIEIRLSKQKFIVNRINESIVILFIFILIPSIAWSLGLINTSQSYLYTLYYIFFTPCIMVYMLENYWLLSIFRTAKLNFKFLGIIVLVPLVCTFLICKFLTNFEISYYWWMMSLAAQLAITTPISVYLFDIRKDRLSQLRDVERALHKSKTDLQFLRSQINPHFLFNTLNTIYGLAILERSVKTAEAVQKLGDMMRFMLEDNLLDFIPLKKEISYLKLYISLQKLRIEKTENIVIDEEIDISENDSQIIPMLLIPLVENAFKYGISLKEVSWIKIKLSVNKNNIEFELSNSLHLHKIKGIENQGFNIGLKNISERLELFYQDKFIFNQEATQNTFLIYLSIPSKPYY